MKFVCSFILVLNVFSLKAQDDNLFDYEWKLEKIVTATETFIAEPYPPWVPPEESELEKISFFDYGNSYEFSYGYYGNGNGFLTFDNTNSSFVIQNFSNHLGGMSYSENFFSHEFIVGNNAYPNPQNPFSYQFYTENNLIYLEITNAEGSVATFFDSQLSIDSFSKLHIKIYPNPTSGYINIEAVDLIINQVQIYDINGKLVSEIKTISNPKIDVTNLSSGIYFLRVETAEGIFSKKVIKI